MQLTEAIVVGFSKFTYQKDGNDINALSVYCTFKDKKVEGSKTCSLFLTDKSEDYISLSDSKIIGKRIHLLQTFSNGKTYFNFVDQIDK